MIAAGLVAQKAAKLGLQVKPWVKTSLAPGSQVVADYLKKAGLQKDLDKLGFNIVGFGCTTCIGNSGRWVSISNQSVLTTRRQLVLRNLGSLSGQYAAVRLEGQT